MKIMLISPMLDGQSGIYLHNSLTELGHKVAYFDWRHMTENKGVQYMNKMLIDVSKQLAPDLMIIVKGLGITKETIEIIKQNIETKIVGWIFDVTLGGTYVKDVGPYVEFLKSLDKFYTIDNDAVEELKALGVNADWLPEGCYPKEHGEQVINSIQAKKYGGEVVFLGSVGTIHPNREKILERIWKEGIDLKIYGEVYYQEGTEPEWVKDCHTGASAINDMHSIVCQSSKVILGIDGWPHRDKSWSARIYRVLCAGGFYLNTHTEGIEKSDLFDCIGTYKDETDIVEKLMYYLSNDSEREEKAKQGQKLVKEKYTFEDSLKRLIKESSASSMEEYLA